MDVPETRYATLGEDHIAYQVIGDGPIDVIFQSGILGHVEAIWEHPLYPSYIRQLATFSRVILFDQRGSGLSDPVPLTALPTLEEWMDDARAVMDAAGSERAAFFAGTNAGPMTLLFAATHPARTSAIILYNSYARFRRASDYPQGAPPQVVDSAIETIRRDWGTGSVITQTQSPAVMGDADARRWWARYERQSGTPRAAATIFGMLFNADVRHVLPLINVPTLILARTSAPFFRRGHSRYLADNIADSKFVELAGSEDFFGTALDRDAILAEVQEFLTGVRPAPEPDRVLATVLFTDLVGSTERAAELGDHRWKELLGRHREIVRRELETHRGREINTSGDGFLATFDGPARAVHCAHAIIDRLRALSLEVRAGLHTGECELMGSDVGGIAVHIAARVAALAGPGEVLVSSTVKDLVAGSGIRFADRGVHALKGVPDEWRLFAVEA